MAQLFTNNAISALAGGITAVAGSLTVTAGHGTKFPAPTGGDYFLLTLFQRSGGTEINHEIVRCTARTTDTLTITRAQEGTSARAFNNADPVELRFTKAAIDLLQDASNLNAGTLAAARLPQFTGGDVTSSGAGSANLAIGANTVTFAKMQDITGPVFLGRQSGAGDPAELNMTTARSMLSVSNVENTALSTWNGSSSITVVGVITSGTWQTVIADGYIASALSGKTYNGLNVSATTGTLTMTNGKTLSVTNTITLSGTDTATLNIGNGGTLGSAAFTSSGAYQAADGDLTAIAAQTGTGFLKRTGVDTWTLDGNSYATTGHNHAGVYEPANANIQSHIASGGNPHGVTATQVGLGNVTNESKATMFTAPAFTGNATGVNLALSGSLATTYLCHYNSNSQSLGVYGGNGFDGAQLVVYGSTNASYAGWFYLRTATGTAYQLLGKPDGSLKWGTIGGENTLWHAGNDGSGSGLDADTVDGAHYASGTYTPVNQNSLNLDNQSIYTTYYMRLGNRVFVHGRIDTLAAATGQTYIDFQLPVSMGTTFAASEEASGSMTCINSYQSAGAVQAVIGQQRVRLGFASTSGYQNPTWVGWTFFFVYLVK
jgi:hypothetical protein